ncbi:putative trancriptional regulator, ArsR family [Halapricum desulfuricans]|uniref:Putative trancriptional regulator, ArsR family n=1 Tax=Halapricum desulfuricans TaxID=2841257 RepID=A0A897NUA4_9EURY|nr:putative trancriptional regulator, ArsR family [Halapricum desulfuricans]
MDGGNLPVVEPGETMNDVGFSFRDPPDDLDLSEATLTFNAIALDETGLDYDPSS